MTFPFKRQEKKIINTKEVIKSLKSLYIKYGQKYGTSVFNLRAFEKRYIDALRKKVDINVFISAELSVFQELKNRFENPAVDEDKPSYSEIANKIIEGNLQRIRKYREVQFHPDAEEEPVRLLGAVTDFYYNNWVITERYLRSLGIKRILELLDKLERGFYYFVVPVRGSYSKAVEDYMAVLLRKDWKENEKAAVRFIRYGGILLNDCLRVINDGINFTEKENPELLNNLEKCREELNSIVQDFRLTEIRSY